MKNTRNCLEKEETMYFFFLKLPREKGKYIYFLKYSLHYTCDIDSMISDNIT